jgi:hypothetical protein
MANIQQYADRGLWDPPAYSQAVTVTDGEPSSVWRVSWRMTTAAMQRMRRLQGKRGIP